VFSKRARQLWFFSFWYLVFVFLFYSNSMLWKNFFLFIFSSCLKCLIYIEKWNFAHCLGEICVPNRVNYFDEIFCFIFLPKNCLVNNFKKIKRLRVQIFWKGHKNLKKSPYYFLTTQSNVKLKLGEFFNVWGFLRIFYFQTKNARQNDKLYIFFSNNLMMTVKSRPVSVLVIQ
jgi:hypothetical protein